MKSISDGVCGYVGGGLGNQLFMLAAAWEQASRLDSPLYIDTSHFVQKNLHGLSIDQMKTPAIFLGENSPWGSFKFGKERALPFPKRFNPLKQKVFVEKNVGKFDPKINQISNGTTLIGYFQSPQYFKNISRDLVESINSFPISTEEQKELSRIEQDPRITLHIRRGDYLLGSNPEQLLTGIDYAQNAINVMRKKGLQTKIRVFSDSPELIKNDLLQIEDVDFELVEDKNLLSPVATLKAMSLGTAFIMSNSTFSWWAAWLLNQKNNDATVIAPRPWSTGNTNRVDLLEKNWLTLDSRP